MANYTTLIKTIDDNIKANGNQEITGPVLNAVLQAIVSGLSEGALFAGIATPATNPPAYDGNVFYIATEPGTYSNFGVIVPNGSIGIIYNTSSDWAVRLINTYYEIDVETLMQDSPSSEDINEAIGSFTYLKRAITVGVPFFGKGASGGNSTVAIAQVKQLSDIEVRVVMLNTGTVDGSNELVPIIKKITNSAGQLSLSTEAPTSFIGPLSSLNTNKKGSVVEAINEVNTGLKSAVKPYVVDLTSLLAAQDSQSISTAIGGIDSLNGTVQKNQVIFGTLANGTVAVGIRVLGNQTTLTYFVDSVVGLTVNEVIITNTSGTLSKTANTHAVLTENMVVNSLESDETTLPLSAAQGKVLNKSIGQPVIEDIDLTTGLEEGYYWHVDGSKRAAADYSIKYVNLSKGDLLIINVMSSDSVAQLTVVDSTHTKVVQAIDSKGESLVNVKSSFLANRDCIVAISYYAHTVVPNTYAYIVKSSQNTAIADLTTSTAALHKVYESYGAVYNKSTGYWELEGITDLTQEDMIEIYLFLTHLIYVSGTSGFVRPVSKYNPRLILLWGGWAMNSYKFDGYDFFASHNKLEKLVVKGQRNQINLIIGKICSGMLMNCSALKDAGLIYLSSDTQDLAVAGREAFRGDSKLNRVLVDNLLTDISFKDSPLISYESLNYLVTNAANTSAITVTVHPTTYSYLAGTAQPTAEVGGTTDEWQALVTTAQAKQISFAVPEETQSEVTE